MIIENSVYDGFRMMNIIFISVPDQFRQLLLNLSLSKKNEYHVWKAK
jgi:hypothetical protein